MCKSVMSISVFHKVFKSIEAQAEAYVPIK